MGVSKNNGTPKSSILIGFSTINHPFWGTPIFGNTHIHQCPGVHKTSGSLCKLRLCSLCSFSSAPLPLHRNFIQFNGFARAKWPKARPYFEMILKAARRRSVPCLKNPGDVIYSAKFGATWRVLFSPHLESKVALQDQTWQQHLQKHTAIWMHVRMSRYGHRKLLWKEKVSTGLSTNPQDNLNRFAFKCFSARSTAPLWPL